MMYCYINIMVNVMDKILGILPLKIKEEIIRYGNIDSITELRLRNGKVLHIYYGINEAITNLYITKEDLTMILKNVSSNSIYSVQQDINNGFITLAGGHRIGVVGHVVLSEGKIKNIKEISSMNIRVAKEYIGVSDKIINEIVDGARIKNVLLLSPPACGKTTLLRDIARKISDAGKNITIVDERGEIAAMSYGEYVLDIGERTDVISFVPKDIGMQMAVRSMAPDVVFTDEIGTDEDANAIKYLCRSGVNFIATMHGNSIKDLMKSSIKDIIIDGYLDTVIVLSKTFGIGTVDKVYTNLRENKNCNVE